MEEASEVASTEEEPTATDNSPVSADVGHINGSSEGSSWNGSKTAFVLQFPLTVKPRKIVEEARKVGLKLKADMVSNIRSVAKKKGQLNPQGQALPKQGKGAREDDEIEFMKLVRRLGWSHAMKLLRLYDAARDGV
jgi:hypothetical protein